MAGQTIQSYKQESSDFHLPIYNCLLMSIQSKLSLYIFQYMHVLTTFFGFKTFYEDFKPVLWAYSGLTLL